MSPPLALPAGLLLLATGILPCFGVGIPAAEYVPGSNNQMLGTLAGSTFISGQSFTSLADGVVGEASIFLRSNGPLPPEISVGIYETASGLPSVLLGSGLITAPSLTNTPTFFAADFSAAHVQLHSGTRYALVAEVPVTGGFSWVGDNPGLYSGGTALESPDAGSSWTSAWSPDLGFSVTMPAGPAAGQAVPETGSTLLLLGMVVAGCGVPWRRMVPARS